MAAMHEALGLTLTLLLVLSAYGAILVALVVARIQAGSRWRREIADIRAEDPDLGNFGTEPQASPEGRAPAVRHR